MNQQVIESRKRRGGGALALAALACLGLLLAWTAVGSTPDPMALAQEALPGTATATQLPPFISPRTTPTFTRTPPSRPAPQSIKYITNPTEAYVLGQRYHRDEQSRSDEGIIPSNTSSVSGEAVAQSFRYFPLILTNDDWLWYKGAGKDAPYPERVFLNLLGGSWWYDWQHEEGNLASRQYAPMVWCSNLPNEPGFPSESWNPQELAEKAKKYPGRVWLIFNEPDFPPGEVGSNYQFGQCGDLLCRTANYATLVPQVTMTPGTTPTATSTFTATPTPRPGVPATLTPTPVWPCSWPKVSDPPAYLDDLMKKMIRMAADRYAQIYRIIKANDPTAKVFCCGNFSGEYDTIWWQKFLEQLRLYHRDVRIDGVAIHAYPWGTSIRACQSYDSQEDIWRCLKPAFERFRTMHIEELQRPDTPLAPNAPIWITEIGYLFDRWVDVGTPTPPPLTSAHVRDYLMKPMVEWLQSGGTGYQAVGWYISIDNINDTPLQTNLFEYVPPPTSPSVLTTPGAYWANTSPKLSPAP